MPSVYVSWNGTCSERAVQEELVELLLPLAERSAARLRAPAPARPAFLEVMSQYEKDVPSIEPIRTYDHEITGRIVLDPCLARDGQRLYEEVQRLDVEQVPIDAGGTAKHEAFCLNLDAGDPQLCLRLSRLGLHGIDFRLFDPRNLYPHADRMSFVFLDSPELPSLCGCLVQVEDHEQCQAYSSEVIRSADWYVCAPNIHLRYYLEEWSDVLLSWVKYFFVTDLYYDRYQELANFDSLRDMIEQHCNLKGVDFVRDFTLQWLVNRFEEEADEWIQRILDM
jgi:hypothetical protein